MARAEDDPRLLRFPEELFAVEYPAPGEPKLAQEIAEIADPTWIGMDTDSWGIDHGTWSVLVHAFPDADIPVVQLSINATQPFDYHLDLGAKLAPLRDRGVLIVGSGNVVHNLRPYRSQPARRGLRLGAQLRRRRGRDHDLRPGRARVAYTITTTIAMAAPTPDHFIPLLYIAGLAAAAGESAHVLVDGYAMGSLSMTSYTLGDHEHRYPRPRRRSTAA